MATISIEVPDVLLRQAGSLERLQEDIQLLLAARFFELGQLNFGQAAAMSGLERADFLREAKRLGVPIQEE